MLLPRIADVRTGQSAEIRPSRAGLLRVTAYAGPGLPFGLGDLLALLVGDLLARAAEASGMQVLTRMALPGGGDDQAEALLKQADLLGIRPPGDTTAHLITGLLRPQGSPCGRRACGSVGGGSPLVRHSFM